MIILLSSKVMKMVMVMEMVMMALMTLAFSNIASLPPTPVDNDDNLNVEQGDEDGDDDYINDDIGLLRHCLVTPNPCG